jgi:hypothetical protein
MRPQTRPFTVEIKSHRRAAPASLRRDDWLGFLPPDQLPGLNTDEELAPVAPHDQQALREASKAFGPCGYPPVAAQPTPGALLAIDPQAQTRRVLPDLVAAAREQERNEILTRPPPRRKRARKAPTPKALKMTPEDEALRVGEDEPAPSTEQTSCVTPALPRASQLAVRLNQATDRTGSRLRRGERWKERRLPRVCWERHACKRTRSG